MSWIMIEGFTNETAALEEAAKSRCTTMLNVADLLLARLHPTRLELVSFLRIELKGDVNYVDIYNKREVNMHILDSIFELAKG